MRRPIRARSSDPRASTARRPREPPEGRLLADYRHRSVWASHVEYPAMHSGRIGRTVRLSVTAGDGLRQCQHQDVRGFGLASQVQVSVLEPTDW